MTRRKPCGAARAACRGRRRDRRLVVGHGAGAPIIIGCPSDVKGNMAPFDGPALAAAQLEIKKINAKGGVLGRPLKLITCDTQNSNPAKSKACAASVIAKGAVIGMVSCDVEFAAPAVQTSINKGMLAVAPCIGTDQMGTKRFGPEGQARVQLRQRGAGRGRRDGRVGLEEGLEDGLARDEQAARLLQDRRAGLQEPVHALGGKIADQESFTTGQNDVGNAVSRLNGSRQTSSSRRPSFGELPGSSRAFARSGTTRRSSTRGPVTAPTG